MAVVQKVLDIATNEIGYAEKNSAADEYTDKVGNKNWTKYAHEIDTLYRDFYNGKKDGYAWCDVFVDWCFIKAFGSDLAKIVLCQPSYSMGAGVSYSKKYYQQNGLLFDKPQVGDQVFFGEAHTGLVVATFTDGSFHTIEGNTTGGNVDTIEGEGGHVAKKVYSKVVSTYKFGRPRWDKAGGYDYVAPAVVAEKPTTEVKLPILRKGDSGESVKSLQQLLTAKKISCGKSGADGDFGDGTYKAVVEFQKKAFPDDASQWDGIVGKLTWNKLLGV